MSKKVEERLGMISRNMENVKKKKSNSKHEKFKVWNKNKHWIDLTEKTTHCQRKDLWT